jgi:hypothetical protein
MTKSAEKGGASAQLIAGNYERLVIVVNGMDDFLLLVVELDAAGSHDEVERGRAVERLVAVATAAADFVEVVGKRHEVSLVRGG